MIKKKRISTASAKAKGRGFQQWVAKKISDILNLPYGKDELIRSREMGQSGVDIVLIGEALKKYPFSIECKKTETWSLPAAIRQAILNQKKGTDWQIFITKNHFPKIVVMDAEIWFKFWDEFINSRRRQRRRK